MKQDMNDTNMPFKRVEQNVFFKDACCFLKQVISLTNVCTVWFAAGCQESRNILSGCCPPSANWTLVVSHERFAVDAAFGGLVFCSLEVRGEGCAGGARVEDEDVARLLTGDD